ncbi:sugar efflux transporter [Colwellia sp. E2M01]|uniref:sugar efflux transporter n=1 Tax=Colwellia sp. E2M01 TaxID=2841561 RepID=UPI001C0A3D3B|nr:sugar efflux transporter [Colwellia sp. E2M01]MBU2870405.1 sugar efflux transporter [Colwellia sp. E2M01]
MSKSSLFTLPACIIYFNASIQALLFALVLPTLSYYVAEQFNENAFWIGIFFILTATTGILFSQLLGYWSDKVDDRRPLILLGMFSGAIACYVFSTSTSYLVSLAVAITFFSLAFSSIAQTFAYARDFAEQTLKRSDIVMFNSILRAFSAFAWVGGPAIGYMSIGEIGFDKHYLLISTLYFLGGIMAWLVLPQIHKVIRPPIVESGNNNRIVTIAVISFSLIFACNQTYLIALPLYITEVLEIDAKWSGWLMGTAAAIEIPIMIFAGWLGARFPLSSLICLGAIAPIFLYIGFWFADDVWILFPLQLGNALMIGFIAGLGMTWFQDLMPNKLGAASALFWNTTNIGNIIGAVVIAIFAQLLGYRDVYLINALIALIASLLLVYVAIKTHKAVSKLKCEAME